MTPPTEDDLDDLAAALAPKLNRIANLELEEAHDFDTKPNVEHRRKLQLRGGRQTDTLGLTDSIEVKLTTVFAARFCAVDNKAARADPAIVIVELYPGAAGLLELYLCPPHYANIVDTFRRRSMAGNGPELHFAGRRILAINPKPLDVVEVLQTAFEVLG